VEKLEVQVAGGLCRLVFEPACSTGPSGCDTSPGVGFTLISSVPARQRPNGGFYTGMGVIGRSDAVAMRDMLDAFIRAHAAGDLQ
jgi:hypothetical protein